MSIFVKREIKNSLIHKISKRNFLIEVENCLADYENSLESLSGSRIKEIASKYRISLDIDFLEERIDLLKRYLDLFFEKLYLSDSEFHSIRHFSNIICLPENVFNKQYEDFASACYEMRIKQYLTDEVITSSERLALEDLRNKLRLSPEVATNTYNSNESTNKKNSWKDPNFDDDDLKNNSAPKFETKPKDSYMNNVSEKTDFSSFGTGCLIALTIIVGVPFLFFTCLLSL